MFALNHRNIIYGESSRKKTVCKAETVRLVPCISTVIKFLSFTGLSNYVPITGNHGNRGLLEHVSYPISLQIYQKFSQALDKRINSELIDEKIMKTKFEVKTPQNS